MMSVVVGVDGTAASRAAIRIAAQEARYRRAPLIAVMAYGGHRAVGARPASRRRRRARAAMSAAPRNPASVTSSPRRSVTRPTM